MRNIILKNINETELFLLGIFITGTAASAVLYAIGQTAYSSALFAISTTLLSYVIAHNAVKKMKGD